MKAINFANVYFILILFCSLAHSANLNPHWLEVSVIEDPSFSIRLRIKQPATLADQDWMKLVLIKKTSTGSVNAYYRIESTLFDLASNSLAASGGLASGSIFYLNNEVSEPLSDYSAALLRLPSKAGYRIEAQIYLEGGIEIDNKKKTFNTPKPDGIPFTFNWLYPSEEEFEMMYLRFKNLLQPNKKRPVEESYLLSTFLKIPELTTRIPLQEMIGFLEARELRTFERLEIAAAIGRDHGKDPELIAYLLRSFKEDKSLSDLYRMQVWDKSFIEPLGRYVETQPTWEISTALSLLHDHRGEWIHNGTFVTALSSSVLKHYPELKMNVRGVQITKENNEKLIEWSLALKELGWTGDRKVIPLLRPALDDCRDFGSESFEGCNIICYCAAIAILTILDGNFENTWSEESTQYYKQHQNYDSKHVVQNIVQKLKLRLSGMKFEK